MKCEIILVTREPVGLCVDSVSDGSVCECSELGVEEGEWWGHGVLATTCACCVLAMFDALVLSLGSPLVVHGSGSVPAPQ